MVDRAEFRDDPSMEKHLQPSGNADVYFEADLLRRYGGRGPRYTSYPTALQFDDSLSVDDYRHNARRSNDLGLPLSLYVHVPFCQALCYYCGCNKIVTRNQARVERYLECLHREIELQSELFDDVRKVEQLHFGGGTPTYLDADQLSTLLGKLDDSFGLDRSDAHEFSIEVDPRTVDAARIRELAALGFNRLSLGIQDFDEQVQKAVNRAQSIDDVRALVAEARNAGFRSISFDLIYGLPLQTADGFERTLDIVVGMRPDRLAVYNYAHLPERFKGQRMINAADLPSADAKLEILHRTIDKLCGAGWEYIGMDHFALPEDDLVKARQSGTLQRNFQGYSTHRHCDLVGLGTSSIGSIDNVFAQNAVTTMQYETLLERDTLPVVRGIATDTDDRVRGAVIQELMCYDGIEFESFGAACDIDFKRYFAGELERLAPLEADGLVTVDDATIRLTPRGRLLMRSVAMVFDRYFTADGADQRFSKAI